MTHTLDDHISSAKYQAHLCHPSAFCCCRNQFYWHRHLNQTLIELIYKQKDTALIHGS